MVLPAGWQWYERENVLKSAGGRSRFYERDIRGFNGGSKLHRRTAYVEGFGKEIL